MRHFTMDGFQGFRSRFDDIRLVQELLEEIPDALKLQPAMPPFVLPYYNGVIAEDCGISAFVFLAGGHFTLHTFSFRETFFADLVYPSPFDSKKLSYLLESGFPCRTTTDHVVDRVPEAMANGRVNVDFDFGPHLMMDIRGYVGPVAMDAIFDVFDRLPPSVHMTPIMRPYVIRGRAADGQPVISAMTMIAESHVALHVFPETSSAYFDLFSCRFFDMELVSGALRAAFPGEHVTETLVARGVDYSKLRREREPEVQRSKGWLRAL